MPEDAKQKYRWREQRDAAAFLALEDGTVYRGLSVGAARDAVGEVVFNTGMTGYQEILSDPSYNGQFVAMTYPEIGNTGCNTADMESRGLFAGGFIVHALNPASNWRAEQELGAALDAAGIPALAGVDTRALTLRLRERGTLKGCLAVTGTLTEEAAAARAREWEGLDGQDYVSRVSVAEPYPWDADGTLTRSWGIADQLPPADLRVVAYDFGIKWNILRGLRRNGIDVTVVPARMPAAEVLAMRPDGVFLSNGPADPAGVPYAVRAVRELLGQVPVMGICLGHQLMALALGARTYRLKFGHHGCNHPVQECATGKVEITSQNHNFGVAQDTLDPAAVEITHINLNDRTVEGIRHRRHPAFAVQYHPEAGPGPHDPYYLFARFRELIETR
ncbi:MAG: glutamine-hydrolyzing carbamoyl-phosphate synthase small subunit [Lentisphaerae bacterium]|nr:glutamine-hydrolyzing carbamoyl-phosphate synthase small subunit [Lentisphaerota bacterium]